MATNSCPHSYSLLYEPLGLDQDHRFLEVGLGSGYGTTLAGEVVGDRGLVVAIDIDPLTFEYARTNLDKTGYTDVILIQDHSGLGCPDHEPYDRIAITAACAEIPPTLLELLGIGGKLIAPVLEHHAQNLIVFGKTATGVNSRIVCPVLYVYLRGIYGIARS